MFAPLKYKCLVKIYKFVLLIFVAQCINKINQYAWLLEIYYENYSFEIMVEKLQKQKNSIFQLYPLLKKNPPGKFPLKRTI